MTVGSDYWDRVSGRKTFHHPLQLELLGRYCRPRDAVVDIGCGYGRLLGQLSRAGFSDLLGLDSSRAMVEGAKRDHPGIPVRIMADLATGLASDSVQVILLFTVLTAVPEDEDQHRLVAECHRILKPGGIIYLSDLLIADDDRNQKRYDWFEAKFDCRGVFRLDDGGIMRHHPIDWLDSLLADFDSVHEETFAFTSMNGNPVTAYQTIRRRKASRSR